MKKTKLYTVTDSYDTDYTRAFTTLDKAVKYICNIGMDRGDFQYDDEVKASMEERESENRVYLFIGENRLDGVVCFITLLNDTEI